jgi:hypothetical protein
VSPVRYGLGFYISEDAIIHSNRRENLKSYIALTGWSLLWRRSLFPVRYELGLYITEDGILHSHRRRNLKSYIQSEEFCRRFITPIITGFLDLVHRPEF